MFSFTALGCVSFSTHKNGNIIDHESKLVHKLAVGADVLIGITALVIGILSLTCPFLGISLSTTAQGALVGVGVAYTGLMLLGIILMIRRIKLDALQQSPK